MEVKFYFDTVKPYESNMLKYSTYASNDWWLISKGSMIKTVLQEMNVSVNHISDCNSHGIYYIDVNGDPIWWNGLSQSGPTHIIKKIPKDILNLVRNKKLRIVIAADREGGPMWNNNIDCFAETHKQISKQKLPKDSVLITQGNRKIKQQYQEWLQKTGNEKLFEVMYSNHFGNIFFDNKLPNRPCILSAMENNSKDFNSLNRVYRPNRGAHVYMLIKDNILENGIVSFNQFNRHDDTGPKLLGCTNNEYCETLSKFFPLHVDGNWSNTNAANQYNSEIYYNSLLTVVTETIFVDDCTFITEKIFKPITMGHPFIVLAGQHTMKGIREMGFRTDFGIDQSYDDIIDPSKRLYAVHEIIKDWTQKTIKEKHDILKDALPAIEHNFKLIREKNFYHNAINDVIESTREYYDRF